MSSSGSVKLRYEKCLQVWGNAKLPVVVESQFNLFGVFNQMKIDFVLIELLGF